MKKSLKQLDLFEFRNQVDIESILKKYGLYIPKKRIKNEKVQS